MSDLTDDQLRGRANDIKAPDGFMLGGLRLVRGDGTILFSRGWWQAPLDWAGEKVWVHERWIGVLGFSSASEALFLEVAPPGFHIYEARSRGTTVICERTDRPDAKPAFRRADHKAWAARMTEPTATDTCKACGEEAHPHEAACIHCGTTKDWAE